MVDGTPHRLHAREGTGVLIEDLMANSGRTAFNRTGTVTGNPGSVSLASDEVYILAHSVSHGNNIVFRIVELYFYISVRIQAEKAADPLTIDCPP